MDQSHLSGSYSHHLRLCSAPWLRTSLTELAYRFACTRATPPERLLDSSISSWTTCCHYRCWCSATPALSTHFEPRLSSVKVISYTELFFHSPPMGPIYVCTATARTVVHLYDVVQCSRLRAMSIYGGRAGNTVPRHIKENTFSLSTFRSQIAHRVRLRLFHSSSDIN